MQEIDKSETVEVTVKIPKQIIEFIEAYSKFSGLNIEQYLADTIINFALGHSENCSNPTWQPKDIFAKYNLSQIEEDR